MISTSFKFDDRESSEFGVSIVRTKSGLINTPYTSSKKILESQPKSVVTPYFLGVTHDPLSFSVTISCDEQEVMDDTKLGEIADWLFQDEYKPFISNDNDSKIYYCIATNKIDFITNGVGDGYFTVNFRCRDAFAWTILNEDIHDLSSVIGSTPLEITNLSNVGVPYYFPIIEFVLQDTETDFSIENTSDGGRTMTFTGLDVGESLYIDCQRKQIISNTSNYRYDEWNKIWFRLVKGVNNLNVTGKCIVTFRTQYPII